MMFLMLRSCGLLLDVTNCKYLEKRQLSISQNLETMLKQMSWQVFQSPQKDGGREPGLGLS